MLRWILVEQREHYLPLKVIKKRLREGDGPQVGAATGPAGAAAAPAAPEPPRSGTDLAEAGVALSPAGVVGEGTIGAATPDPESAAWYLDDGPEAAFPSGDDIPVVVPGDDGLGSGGGAAAVAEPPGRERAVEELWTRAGPGRTYSRAELAREAGLDEAALAELESYGLIRAGELDDESLRVARVAAGFFGYGVEARHLRMYKQFAEREAGLFEQAVMPMANSRQAEMRAQATEALADLARLGQALRLVMLRAALSPPAGG